MNRIIHSDFTQMTYADQSCATFNVFDKFLGKSGVQIEILPQYMEALRADWRVRFKQISANLGFVESTDDDLNRDEVVN